MADPEYSAQILFTLIHNSDDDLTKATLFGFILRFFDEKQIVTATNALGYNNISAEKIQDLVLMHSVLGQCKKAGISLTARV